MKVWAAVSLFCQVTVVFGSTVRIKGLKRSWAGGMVTVVSKGAVFVGGALVPGEVPGWANTLTPSTTPRIPPRTTSNIKTAIATATIIPDRADTLSIETPLLLK